MALCFLSKSASESEYLFFFSFHCLRIWYQCSCIDICSFNPVDSFIWFELYGSPSDRDVDLIGSVRTSSCYCKTHSGSSMLLLLAIIMKIEFVNRLYRRGMLWDDWALSIHLICRFVHHPLCYFSLCITGHAFV